MIDATRMDLYQLTSLVPHWDAGLADTPVTMSFFSRRLPKGVDGGPAGQEDNAGGEDRRD